MSLLSTDPKRCAHTAAVLLAAGASSRMRASKALLPWRGSSCLRHLVGTFSLVCRPVVLVLAEDAQGQRLLEEVLGKVLPVYNTTPERGPISSLRLAAERLLADGVTSAIICPVDQPAVALRHVHMLVEALKGARVAMLSHEGQDGHPYGLSDLQELLLLGEGQTARDLMYHEGLVRLEAGPEVLLNLNTPSDYESAYARYGIDGDNDGKDS
jgi:CTP:molybdopterin cytidylyltransferase MocA